MRSAKKVAIATVALATSLAVTPVAPVADAQIERQPYTAGPSAPTDIPPVVTIGGVLYALVNGTYVRADEALLQSLDPSISRGEKDPNTSEPDGKTPDTAPNGKGSSSTQGSNIAAWLAPLLIIPAVVGTVIAVFRSQFPTGRFMLYFQPGDQLGRTFG
ncbi:hypothetical protein [Corynebacterium meitnerae]|uniref:Secreted protein n=1 Tax=Corynebacterium meitnerae TaxID=2913498 RepID=A0A9X3LVB6_9CORY|nr:hypothetical protein [Corynebacterium meitnerae]MCZ9293458.1 hypothetical protein [Corynebacterium meitnerae]